MNRPTIIFYILHCSLIHCRRLTNQRTCQDHHKILCNVNILKIWSRRKYSPRLSLPSTSGQAWKQRLVVCIICIMVLGSWYLTLSTWHLVLDTGYLALTLGTWNLVPTWYLICMTLSSLQVSINEGGWEHCRSAPPCWRALWWSSWSWFRWLRLWWSSWSRSKC